MGLNDDLKTFGAARASEKSDYFRDGTGTAVVSKLLYEEMNGGKTFVARLRIVESKAKVAGVDPNLPGTEVGWVQQPQKFKSAAGNIKAFLCTLDGTDANVITPDDFATMAGSYLAESQPGIGMLVRFDTYQQATKSGPNAGKVNTYVRFSHVAESQGNSKGEIAARRKEILG